jgi:DNA topoisomerase-1
LKEQILPDLQIGQILKTIKIETITKKTEPPVRYNQGSIIKEMEKRNLGTKATRAEILQTLYKRSYIKEHRIVVTKLGEAVVNVLTTFCPKIVGEELIKKFEEQMDDIMQERKFRGEILEEAIDLLLEVLYEFKNKEHAIGKALLESYIDVLGEEKYIGICNKCQGILTIIRSKKSKKSFIGCSSYPSCTNIYPLPQQAKIRSLGIICKQCETPIINIIRKGKKTFRMCLDPFCPKKSGWKKQVNQNS